MADPRDCPALVAEPVSSVAEVVARLTEIRDCTRKVAPGGGITQFSGLYLTITENIQEKIKAKSFFDDDAYLARLDVVFANRFFDALRAWAGGGAPPRVWEMLFDCPADGERSPFQLAGAGVNAHINFDLAVAVVDTGREMGDQGLTGREADYVKINEVFAQEMDTLLSRLRDGGEGVDEDPRRLSVLGQIMTRVVRAARGFAWADAEKLWLIDRKSSEWIAKERDMDGVACFVGGGILINFPF